MGFFSRFENKMEDAVEGTANKLSKSPISPVQISKQCEKHMMRNKIVGAGKQYAPTLYTVLVNPDDDARLFSFYPTLAGEIETTIRAKADQVGLFMDGQPLVRFIVDDNLKHGKFDVIAEMVASGIVVQLRAEEMERYGLSSSPRQPRPQQAPPQQQRQRVQAPAGYGDNAPALAQNQERYVQDGHPRSDFQDDPFGDALYDDPFDDSYDTVFNPESQDNPFGTGVPINNASAGDFDPFAPQTRPPASAGLAGAIPTPISSPSAPSSRAHQQGQGQPLLIDDTNGKTYVLAQSGMIAGRSKDCSIVIPDINASRQHARFVRDANGRWSITDLGSKNGTLVNGEFIQDQTPIYDGDVITLGLTTYIYTER